MSESDARWAVSGNRGHVVAQLEILPRLPTAQALVTRREILKLGEQYSNILRDAGARVRHVPDTRMRFDLCREEHRLVYRDHLAWCVAHIPEVIDGVRGYEIAMRWIGIAQAGMVALGMLTIAESRELVDEFRERRET